MIARVCAWCDRVLGTKPGPPGVSHGICDTCLPAFLRGVAVLTSEDKPRDTNGARGALTSRTPVPGGPVGGAVAPDATATGGSPLTTER